MKASPFLLALALGFVSARAEVKLPAIISDHMVLQKSPKTCVWGWASPGEMISVKLDAQSVQARADASGKWQAFLDLSQSKSGPFQMTVKGANQIVVNDVLVGEVWLASGQSNMGVPLNQATGADAEIAASANSLLREFDTEMRPAFTPQDEVGGKWEVSAPGPASRFSAVAYFFGKTLQKKLNVPVGMISSPVGGTHAESWISQRVIDADADLKACQAIEKDLFLNYADRLKQYAANYDAWAKKYGFEPPVLANPAAFAAEDLSAGDWKKIKLPAKFADFGLPDCGITWLRKEVTVPKNLAGVSLRLDLGGIRNFTEVYWDGVKFAQTDASTPNGTEGPFSYTVPGNLVKEGRNVIAVRVISPLGGAGLSAHASGSGFRVIQGRYVEFLAGDWLAKEEKVFQPPTPEVLADFPKPVKSPPIEKNVSGVLFNGMIYPHLLYTIQGVIWYQGESNTSHAVQYTGLFSALIKDWRAYRNQPELPFYFVQIAPFGPKDSQPAETERAELREAQDKTLSLPHTGMATLIDIGEELDLHPRDKKDVGERLALIALANTYGRQIAFSGPRYKAMKIEGNAIRLQFDHVDGGLVARPLPDQYIPRTIQPDKTVPLVRHSPQSDLQGFAICGADHKWVWADAKIDGDTVIVSSPQVSAPVAVRYAWSENPTCNLYNKAGLPAPPFRTDDFPRISTKRIPGQE